MGVLDVIGGILLLLACIGIVVLVAMQESPRGGIGALTGGDSYFNKNQNRTLDAVLSRFTKYFGIAFFIIAIAVYAVDIYLN